MKELESLKEELKKFPDELTSPFKHIENMTIPDIVEKRAKEHPKKIAFINDNKYITYGEFEEEINKAAMILKKHDVKPHDKVGILMRNCLEWIYFYFGIQRNGAIVLPINTFYREKELKYILRDSEAKVIIAGDEFQELIKSVKNEVITLKTIIIVGGQNVNEGMLSLEVQKKELEQYKRIEFENLSKPWFDAIYFYTSGTTGEPKGVVLTHYSCLVNIVQVNSQLELKTDDRFLISTPLWHCAPSHAAILPGLTKGISFIIERQFSLEILNSIEKYKATAMLGVPAIYIMILQSDKIKEINMSSMRMFVYGSAIMPFNTIKCLKQQYPKVKLINGYGLTETSEAFTFLNDDYALLKPGSVGKAAIGAKFLPEFCTHTAVTAHGR